MWSCGKVVCTAAQRLMGQCMRHFTWRTNKIIRDFGEVVDGQKVCIVDYLEYMAVQTQDLKSKHAL